MKTDLSKPTIWLAPFSRDELCEEPGDAKTQKRLERFTLATSMSLAYRQLSCAKRLSCRFVDSFSWSRRDFCQDGKNKKTCTKQV
ncbi:hypothetical protein [Rheinheimera tilapiae]|uniref:Uncharacterized protein n=1 Tax=Rheinheimera tilapiae TaxID=875043 RepID=A0ABV6BA23_9GAMM